MPVVSALALLLTQMSYASTVNAISERTFVAERDIENTLVFPAAQSFRRASFGPVIRRQFSSSADTHNLEFWLFCPCRLFHDDPPKLADMLVLQSPLGTLLR